MSKKKSKSPFTVVLIKDKDGSFTAYIEEMPEVITGGENEKKAIANLSIAMKEVLAAKREISQMETKGQKIIRKPFQMAFA